MASPECRKALPDLIFYTELHPLVSDHLRGLILLCFLTLNDLPSALKEASAITELYFSHPIYRNLSRFLLSASRCEIPEENVFPDFVRKIAVDTAFKLALDHSCTALLRFLLLRYPYLPLPPDGVTPPFSFEENWSRIVTLVERFGDLNNALLLARKLGVISGFDSLPLEKRIFLFRLAFLIGDFNLAEQWFSELLKEKRLSIQHRGELYLLYYRLLMRQDRINSARSLLARALKERLLPAQKLAFFYRLGLLSEGMGNLKEAEHFYARGSTLAGEGAEGEELLVRLGLLWLRLGKTEEKAYKLWEKNLAIVSPKSKPRFLYLIGSVHPPLYQENCKKISLMAPFTYYHYLCSPDILKSQFYFFPALTLPSLRLPKAQLLEEIGIPEGAIWEWERYGYETTDLATKIAIAQRVHDLGFPWIALSFLSRTLALDPWVSGERREREIWEVLYPLPYWDLVSQAASDENLDPYLLYAMMRQESRFHPWAQSRAYARGLLQLLWETAKSLIESETSPLSSPTELFEPRRNIFLGARYIRKLLDRFEGNIYLALSAYNAGPSRVEEWRRISLPRNIWVESIPIEETRTYVKKVLENYFRYRLLYHPPPPPP